LLDHVNGVLEVLLLAANRASHWVGLCMLALFCLTLVGSKCCKRSELPYSRSWFVWNLRCGSEKFRPSPTCSEIYFFWDWKFWAI